MASVPRERPHRAPRPPRGEDGEAPWPWAPGPRPQVREQQTPVVCHLPTAAAARAAPSAASPQRPQRVKPEDPAAVATWAPDRARTVTGPLRRARPTPPRGAQATPARPGPARPTLLFELFEQRQAGDARPGEDDVVAAGRAAAEAPRHGAVQLRLGPQRVQPVRGPALLQLHVDLGQKRTAVSELAAGQAQRAGSPGPCSPVTRAPQRPQVTPRPPSAWAAGGSAPASSV